MPADTYRLKLVRGEEQFEAEGDEKFVLEMLARHWTGGASVQPSPKGRRGPHRASSDLSPEEPLAIPSKAISAGEFIRQLGIKKHTDQILAFGYFLEKYQGQPSFGAADINNLYYEAKLESSNTSQMIIYNIRAGLMMEAKGEKKGKKKYTLTQNGERKIKERLESASAPAAK